MAFLPRNGRQDRSYFSPLGLGEMRRAGPFVDDEGRQTPSPPRGEGWDEGTVYFAEEVVDIDIFYSPHPNPLPNVERG